MSKWCLFLFFNSLFLTTIFSQNSTPEFKTIPNGKKALFLKKKQLTKGLYERGSCYNGICRAYKNGFAGFLDYKGNEIVSFKYSNAYAFSEGLIAVYNGYKWGFINKKDEVKIPFQFDTVSNFNEGRCLVAIRNNNLLKYGFINTKGIFIVDYKYENAHSFSEGFAAVLVNNLWGFIDKNGKNCTPFKYCEIKDFKNGIALVDINCSYYEEEDITIKNSLTGAINTKGEEIIPLIHENIRVWNKGSVIEAVKNNTVGLYNSEGNIIIPFGKYHSINRFDETSQLIEVTKDDDKLGYVNGFINLKGKEIIPCKYRFSSYFINDFIYAQKDATEEELIKLRATKRSFSNRRSGVIHKNGTIIIPFQFKAISVFRNGFFKVEDYVNKGVTNHTSTFAFYNKKGEQILPFKYSYATDFSKNGYALVKENKGYKFIDTYGKIISIPKYDKIDPYIFNDLTAVFNGDKWGFINAKNEIIIDFQFDEANRFHKGLAKVSNNKKHGFINTKGEVIIPIKFDKANYYFTDEIEELILDGKKQYYNKKGKVVFDEELIRKNGYR